MSYLGSVGSQARKYKDFVRSIITDLPQILIGELGRTTGMFLAWF